jgi:hypothetical protein
MFSIRDLELLLDLSGEVHMLVGGYHVSIRAELRDANPNRPHGVDYGLRLMGPDKECVLGFDNRHKYDGASLSAPWDHEHRYDRAGVTFAYNFRSAGVLLADFWDRIDAYAVVHQRRTGVKLL